MMKKHRYRFVYFHIYFCINRNKLKWSKNYFCLWKYEKLDGEKHSNFSFFPVVDFLCTLFLCHYNITLNLEIYFFFFIFTLHTVRFFGYIIHLFPFFHSFDNDCMLMLFADCANIFLFSLSCPKWMHQLHGNENVM